jgi:hypothetical protein
LYIIVSFQTANVLTAILKQAKSRIQIEKDKVEKPVDERVVTPQDLPCGHWQAVSGTARYRFRGWMPI